LVRGLCGLFAIAALAVVRVPAFAQPAPLEMTLGWLTNSGGSSAIMKVMVDNQLFDKRAAALGVPIKPKYVNFQTGPAMNEAVAAGQIDIDAVFSALVLARRIGAGVQSTPIAVVGSHLSNAILVRPGSPIKSVEDLPGKTIGLPLGSSAQYLLNSILAYHFGKTDRELGIRVVNMSPGDTVNLAKGVDASIAWMPLRFIGPAAGVAELLIDTDGTTGKAYKTPGVKPEQIKKSWAYPEGYNTDRLYAATRTAFLEKHPDVVLAFLLAFRDAQQMVLKDIPGTKKAINEIWKLPQIVVDQTFDAGAETAGIRNEPSILEWDVLTIVKASEFLTHIKAQDETLTFEKLRPIFLRTAELQRRAWDMSEPKMSVATMEKGFSGTGKTYGSYTTNGGKPVWEWQKDPNWGQRLYKPGPFGTAK
jgi:ABC-type nitrate/sulfonate/bicarbonate transport system substrate-binding protein